MTTNIKMKEILRQHGIDHDEPKLLLRCAEWTADTIEYYEFKPVPMKPQEVREFEEIPEEDRLHLDVSYFDHNPQIKIYYNSIRTIKSENKAIYDWLKECRDRLSDDQERYRRIHDKIKDVTIEMIA